MRHAIALFVLIALAIEPGAAQAPLPPPGIYSSEEQAYFAKEAGQPSPPPLYLRIDEKGAREVVDAFGKPLLLAPLLTILSHGPAGLEAQLPNGEKLDLRRARPATCWVAVKKDQPKADGSPDWHFQQGVRLHDQGGRALVGGGESGAPPVVIRMRNVVWPATAAGTRSTNKPSVVLYVHKPDKPDSAESYVWADPGAARIGINLRWMQASCGIDGMEQPSAVTATNFRG